MISLIINKIENKSSLFIALLPNGFPNGFRTDFYLDIYNYFKCLYQKNGTNSFFSIHSHISLKNIKRSGGCKIIETCIYKIPFVPFFLNIYLVILLESLNNFPNGFFKKSVRNPFVPFGNPFGDHIKEAFRRSFGTMPEVTINNLNNRRNYGITSTC